MATVDLTALRKKLSDKTGVAFWRSLEEAADLPELREALEREFPPDAFAALDPISRRSMLKLMGASLALRGFAGCARQPDEWIVPYVNQPEAVVPGRPLYFASAASLAGYGRGVLVESHTGRPTRVEGNIDHPASLGGTDVFMQASVLGLYDPDRSSAVLRMGQASDWNTFVSTIVPIMQAARSRAGAGLRILTGAVTSPTLADQLTTLLQQLPQAQWHSFEPAGQDMARAGAQLAFGQVVDPIYRFDQADVIVSLESDFLGWGPGQPRYARDWARRRQRVDGVSIGASASDEERRASGITAGSTGGTARGMSRLYVVESTPSLTGARADHRLPLKSSRVADFAAALAAAVGVASGGGGRGSMPGVPANWISQLAADLKAHGGSSLVIAGDQQAPQVHALAHAINEALGNVGKTVSYVQPVEFRPARGGNGFESLSALVRDIDAGGVETLIILDCNPVYSAPADLEIERHMAAVRSKIHFGQHVDETAALCQWHIPQTHELETWSDVRAVDGTVSLIQPLIAPLHRARTIHELVSTLLGDPWRSSYELVRGYWQRRFQGGDFETFWREALRRGVVPDTAAPPQTVSLQPAATRSAAVSASASGLELAFRPDYGVFDGRFANNPWLQELPHPLTKISWDNAVLISPTTAERLSLSSGDTVELRYRGRSVTGPLWVMPGQADDSVTVHLGYGRWSAGEVGSLVGFNASRLRTADAPWFGGGLELHKTGSGYAFATTQGHGRMEGRDLAREGTLAEYRRTPDFALRGEDRHARERPLIPEYDYSGYAWAMTIDLNVCIGCQACVVACQAENNIPVVGKKEVSRGREMYWIRIDRYYKGGLDDPGIVFQPVTCMHCEKAPCELVCPVEATLHDNEGLNVMVYNRCVGTRYCSNNCPYKVRRFNFLLYSDWETPALKAQRNPDVTVRSRGVMEKCTYCVQRISQARIEAKKENRRIRDGEVVVACQAACPTRVIEFGDLNDPGSRVALLANQPRNYPLLGELNTQPRTTYLAALRNPGLEPEKG